MLPVSGTAFLARVLSWQRKAARIPGENMHFHARRGFTLVELMVVIAILGLLVSVLAFTVTRHFTKANADLDKVNMGKLYSELQAAANDPSLSRRMNSKDNRDRKGREFFEGCFRSKILDNNMLDNVVSLGGADAKPEAHSLGDDFELDPSSCSFTAPKMGEFKRLLTQRERKVVFAFNSANWHNYDSIGFGALITWSDGATAEYLTAEDAAEYYGIDETEWEAPSELFGEVEPFDQTYE
jgi:prepilin-type N-terminal cleavage/methylation domain-containing protein